MNLSCTCWQKTIVPCHHVDLYGCLSAMLQRKSQGKAACSVFMPNLRSHTLPPEELNLLALFQGFGWFVGLFEMVSHGTKVGLKLTV